MPCRANVGVMQAKAWVAKRAQLNDKRCSWFRQAPRRAVTTSMFVTATLTLCSAAVFLTLLDGRFA